MVRHVERWVSRRLRGADRAHGRAQALRQYNSPKEGYAQFVAVEAAGRKRLAGLQGPARQHARDDVVVRAVQAKAPVELLAIERWARDPQARGSGSRASGLAHPPGAG